MTWNSTWPIGNISVKDNRPPGQQNTTYIETTMGNAVIGTNTADTRDHFWNVDATIDGYHRHVKLVGFTEGGITKDPVIDGSSANAVMYSRQLTTFENPVAQGYECFTRTANNIFNYLGFRALAVWNTAVDPIPQNNVKFSHNILTQPGGIIKTGVGIYQINFANALPTSGYVVLGSGYASSGVGNVVCCVSSFGAVFPNPLKDTTVVGVEFTRNGSYIDPVQAWVAIIGG